MSADSPCSRCREIPLDLFLGKKMEFQLELRKELRRTDGHCKVCGFWLDSGPRSRSTDRFEEYRMFEMLRTMPLVLSSFQELTLRVGEGEMSLQRDLDLC